MALMLDELSRLEMEADLARVEASARADAARAARERVAPLLSGMVPPGERRIFYAAFACLEIANLGSPDKPRIRIEAIPDLPRKVLADG
jgi:hypothetical protein